MGDGSATLEWEGGAPLLSSDSVTGPFSDTGLTSPATVDTTSGAAYYILGDGGGL